MTVTKRLSTLLLSIILLAALVMVTGCDWSAMWDLRRAEKILKKAEKLNAEFWDFNRRRTPTARLRKPSMKA
jgi:uncharacterized membrane protein YcjF (UPF0283 family)